LKKLLHIDSHVNW